MSNPAGTRFETDATRHAHEAGFPDAERLPRKGAKDIGDLRIVPDWTIEAKAVKSIDLASFVDQAREEAVNGGTTYFGALVKRRRKSIGEAYFVTTYDQRLAEWRRQQELEQLVSDQQTELEGLGMALEILGRAVTHPPGCDLGVDCTCGIQEAIDHA